MWLEHYTGIFHNYFIDSDRILNIREAFSGLYDTELLLGDCQIAYAISRNQRLHYYNDFAESELRSKQRAVWSLMDDLEYFNNMIRKKSSFTNWSQEGF